MGILTEQFDALLPEVTSAFNAMLGDEKAPTLNVPEAVQENIQGPALAGLQGLLAHISGGATSVRGVQESIRGKAQRNVQAQREQQSLEARATFQSAMEDYRRKVTVRDRAMDHIMTSLTKETGNRNEFFLKQFESGEITREELESTPYLAKGVAKAYNLDLTDEADNAALLDAATGFAANKAIKDEKARLALIQDLSAADLAANEATPEAIKRLNRSKDQSVTGKGLEIDAARNTALDFGLDRKHKIEDHKLSTTGKQLSIDEAKDAARDFDLNRLHKIEDHVINMTYKNWLMKRDKDGNPTSDGSDDLGDSQMTPSQRLASTKALAVYATEIGRSSVILNELMDKQKLKTLPLDADGNFDFSKDDDPKQLKIDIREPTTYTFSGRGPGEGQTSVNTSTIMAIIGDMRVAFEAANNVIEQQGRPRIPWGPYINAVLSESNDLYNLSDPFGATLQGQTATVGPADFEGTLPEGSQ